MKKSTIIIIRWILTIGLVAATYFETGAFTALSFLLLFLSTEIFSESIKRLASLLRQINKALGDE